MSGLIVQAIHDFNPEILRDTLGIDVNAKDETAYPKAETELQSTAKNPENPPADNESPSMKKSHKNKSSKKHDNGSRSRSRKRKHSDKKNRIN